jgi:UDP-N-acetylmuramoyl-tripeptide--D-alanyl-D-alanine ligase
MRFDQHFLLRAVPQASVLHGTFQAQTKFSIDSRTLQPGDIFIALNGAKHDGHEFVSQALKKGAAGFFIAENNKALLQKLDATELKDKLVVLVPDTLDALVQMACMWRSQFSYPMIAVTGSVGKTTTKEILSNILTLAGMSHVKSAGNYNTKIGLALTMLTMRPEDQACVVEIGISKRGEMVELAKMVQPTVGIITIIGHSHMEGLGSLNDIALEKRALFTYFNESNIGIVNGDQAILASVGYMHPVIKFGAKTTNQLQARKINIGDNTISCTLKIYKEKFSIQLKNTHAGTIFNALAAGAAAYLLKIPTKTIVQGMQMPVAVSGRFERRLLKDNRGLLIHDCYNASPESMKAALLALQKIDSKAQKVAVLGDMLELGVNSPFWHRQLGRFLRKVPSLRHLILVGDMVKWTKKTVPVTVVVEMVPTWQDAIAKLQEKLSHESVVLVKGSRGMALNNLVDHFSRSPL